MFVYCISTNNSFDFEEAKKNNNIYGLYTTKNTPTAPPHLPLQIKLLNVFTLSSASLCSCSKVSRDIANTLTALNGSYDVVSYPNGSMAVVPHLSPGEKEEGKLLLSALPVPGRPAAGFLIQTTSSAGQLAICTILQFLPLACRVAGLIKTKGR